MSKKQLFYHGSGRPLPLKTLDAKKRKSYFDPNIEKLVNKLRPKGCTDRMQCWFLVKQKHNISSAGGYLDYVYEVNPKNKVSKHHFGWIACILRIFNYKYNHKTYKDNEKLINKCIKNYWSGKYYNSSKDLGGSTWEWLSPKVKIVKKIEEDV